MRPDDEAMLKKRLEALEAAGEKVSAALSTKRETLLAELVDSGRAPGVPRLVPGSRARTGSYATGMAALRVTANITVVKIQGAASFCASAVDNGPAVADATEES